MKIPSDIKYIRKVSAEVEDFLKSKNVEKSLIFDIRLSLEEAIKNAIIHGNKNRKGLSVFITYSLKGGSFTMEVEDQGAGFDPAGVPDPTLEENLYKGGGRGVFLIEKLMDKVRYNDRGNKVFMLKNLTIAEGSENAN
jgi:serine/threonine-protein kinase RsbW